MRARVRPEAFGYAILGNGRVMPVREEALVVIQAINGSTTFLELGEKFGQPGLNLLGELWSAGMISID
jgi:hypothetical protein